MLNIEDLEGTGLSKNKMYIGVVVDNKDPRKLDRVRIRVPDLFDGIEDNMLPWSIPNNNVDATSNSGVCDIPQIGAKVRIRFQGGSPDHPEYFPYLVDESVVIKEKLQNYPHRKVRKFSNGTYIILDTHTNEIFVYHKGGDAHLNFVDSNVILDIEGNLDCTVSKNLDCTVGGNMECEVSGNIVGKSKNYTIQCDNFVVQASTISMSGQLSASGGGTMTGNIKIEGNMDVEGASLKHKGKNVGDTHTHTSSSPGSPTSIPN